MTQSAKRNLSGHGGAVLFGEVLRHIGIDEPRGDAVRRHAAAAKLAGDGAREADQAGLRGGVVRLAAVAARSHNRGQIDDAAVARLQHRAAGRAAEVENRGEVGRDHVIPVGVLHAHEEAVARDAGVIHEDIELTEFLHDRRNELFSFSVVRDIQHDTAPLSGSGEALRDPGSARLTRRRADHKGAHARERLRDRVTDTAARARYEGNAAFQRVRSKNLIFHLSFLYNFYR